MAGRTLNFLREPPRTAELAIWLFVCAMIVAVRLYLIHLVPVILWSNDSGSYIESALKWLHGGPWESDPRRGPVYSLVIAGVLKLWRNFDALMVVQHVLGGLAVLLAVAVLRLMHTRRSIFAIGFAGYCYAIYSLPLLLEHLLRNETLLFVFATLIFASWWLALRADKPHWLWLTGIATGLMQLTKAVFAPFPLVLVLLHLWFFRRQPKRAAIEIGVFLLAFGLTLAGGKLHRQWTLHERPLQPQSGILLYGRTAQFTVLDGGIEPELKELIRTQVEDYRKLPQLNNNIVLKDTIVPTLKTRLKKQGASPSDLNRLCRRFAFEAIMAHQWAYAKQVFGDINTLLLHTGYHGGEPNEYDVRSSDRRLRTDPDPDPIMRRDEALKVHERLNDRAKFADYRHWTNTSFLFRIRAPFFTTLLLPLFIFFTTGKRRLWWLGVAAMWYFTVLLLSTVGRPLDRYLLPGAPLMFWTMASALVFAWNWALDWWAARQPKMPVQSAPAV